MDMNNGGDREDEKNKYRSGVQDKGKGYDVSNFKGGSLLDSGAQFSGSISEKGAPSVPSTQVMLSPLTKGLTTSDEEYVGLVEDTAVMELVKSHEKFSC